MSRHDYEVSREIAARDYPFYALIMAAIRQADTRNAAALRRAFPLTYDELEARFHAPGGVLPYESGECDGCICPEHEAPRSCPEHGDPAGVHPMYVCAHVAEEDQR